MRNKPYAGYSVSVQIWVERRGIGEMCYLMGNWPYLGNGEKGPRLTYY